jgi:hypothetical protein
MDPSASPPPLGLTPRAPPSSLLVLYQSRAPTSAAWYEARPVTGNMVRGRVPGPVPECTQGPGPARFTARLTGAGPARFTALGRVEPPSPMPPGSCATQRHTELTGQHDVTLCTISAANEPPLATWRDHSECHSRTQSSPIPPSAAGLSFSALPIINGQWARLALCVRRGHGIGPTSLVADGPLLALPALRDPGPLCSKQL